LIEGIDRAVKPFPVLQSINLIIGLSIVAWEWPIGLKIVKSIYQNIKPRLAILPLAALAVAFLYQTADTAIYYLIGAAVYFWSYHEQEVIVISTVL
jgi:hypothetical protein